MTTVALIPARSGSTRLVGKNLLCVGAHSLVARAILSALDAGCEAWVSTDSDAIAAEAHKHGARVNLVPMVPDRSDLRAEMAAWWATLPEKPDALVLLNPTSPLRTGVHVREALALLERTGADSVVSVCEGHEPHFAGLIGATWERWSTPETWQPIARFESRPRTQDLPRAGWENGAIFAVTRSYFEREHNFTGGHAVAYVMPRAASVDVDDAETLEMARALYAWGLSARRKVEAEANARNSPCTAATVGRRACLCSECVGYRLGFKAECKCTGVRRCRGCEAASHPDEVT